MSDKSSKEQHRQLWQKLVAENWEKAEPEIRGWEDLLDGDLDDWDCEPQAAERASLAFQGERQQDLELLQTIQSERDFVLNALREARTLHRLAEITNIFHDCISRWESHSLVLQSNTERVVAAIDRAVALFRDASGLCRERLGSIQSAKAKKAEVEAKERETREKMRETQKETNDYIRGLREETAKKARESRDRNHKLWLDAHFGHSHCLHCRGPKLYGHRYCCDCDQGRHRFFS